MNTFMSDRGKPQAKCARRMAQVIHPTDKVLLVEEDEGTIDDGNWDPTSLPDRNLLATRHERVSKPSDTKATTVTYPYLRGNALMTDGHADYVRRDWAHDPSHYFPLQD
jgi:hypothetical protein